MSIFGLPEEIAPPAVDISRSGTGQAGAASTSSARSPERQPAGRKRKTSGSGKAATLAWPLLERLGLTEQERRARCSGIGGSDANVILSGNPDKVLELWREKRGEGNAKCLEDILPVMLGSWTEPFNRQWFEKVSGEKVFGVGRSQACNIHSWRRCTLDGLVHDGRAVFEAKHTSAFKKPEEVLERYMPQLQHNMAVANCETAVLSVIFGNHKYEMFEIAADWLYQLELLEAEEAFWDCVQSGKLPVTPSVPLPPKPVGVREVCLEGSNSWASAAVDWLEHRDAAKCHAAACGTIKTLVEADVARAFGHGIEARRSKSGALSIRELSQ